MLALVVVDNLVLFYAFWELVGFSSYLLIGFWFTRDKAVQANKKAFIMNRIGDIGLLTAICIFLPISILLILIQLFGTQWPYCTIHTLNDGIWIAPLRVSLRMAIHCLRRHIFSRRGQIGTVPATYLAARCHGGADFGFGAYPCRYHGGRRCVFIGQGLSDV